MTPIEQVKAILDIVTTDRASKKEVALLISGLTKVINDAKKAMEDVSTETKGKCLEMCGKVEDELSSYKADLDAIVKEAEKTSKTNLSNLAERFEEAISEVYRTLNTVENFDPSGLQESINNLEDESRAIKSSITTQINDSEGRINKRIDEELEKLEKLINELKKIKGTTAVRGLFGGRRVYQPYIDRFTSQTNGVTKSFTLSRAPIKSDTILVWGTDFPIILDPSVDFTVSGKVLTLSASIPAPSSGATLLIQYYA